MLHFFEYSRESYLCLVLLTSFFIVRREERKALLLKKPYEWSIVILPFFMLGIESVLLFSTEVKISILSLLWVGMTFFTTYQLYLVERDEQG